MSTTTAPAPRAHALLSPSSSERWTACTGSAALLERGKYEDKAGLPAASGTFLHGIAAKALTAGRPAADYLGERGEVEGFHFTLGDKEVKLVQTYIDAVYSYAAGLRAQGKDVKVFIEQELDISWLTGEPGAVGTADCIIVAEDEIVVVDLKTGSTYVSPTKNSQLAMYAAAAIRAYENGALTAAIPLPAIDQAAPTADELEDLL